MKACPKCGSVDVERRRQTDFCGGCGHSSKRAFPHLHSQVDDPEGEFLSPGGYRKPPAPGAE